MTTAADLIGQVAVWALWQSILKVVAVRFTIVQANLRKQ